MKRLVLIVALAFGGLAAQPASAQVTTRTTTTVTPRGAERTTVVRTPVQTERRMETTRQVVTRTHRDSGWHMGQRRKVCTVRYRNHRRIRTCRWR